jgi:hypothetical protein
MDDKKPYNPPWDHSFQLDPEVKCVLCCQKGISVFVRGKENQGICEACAVIAHYMWRQEPGEVPPEYPESAMTKISRVYVAIARLSDNNEDEQGCHSEAQPMLPNSYDFAMVTREDDGTLDLPGTDVQPGETLREATERVLASLKVKTWAHPDFVESLYTAYTPRGRLATVMFVSAWGMVDEKAFDDGLDWRHAPLSSRATVMGGFYKALESVWAMRLYHHFRVPSHTEAICVKVSGMGASYFELERLLRAGKKNLDTSMAELMRRQMSADERLIAKMLAEHAEMATSLEKEQGERVGSLTDAIDKVPTEMSGEESAVRPVELQKQLLGVQSKGADDDSSAVVAFGATESVEEEDNSTDEAPQDEEGTVVLQENPPEGFVQKGRPLSMKLS